jgi:hypothetical protein
MANTKYTVRATSVGTFVVEEVTTGATSTFYSLTDAAAAVREFAPTFTFFSLRAKSRGRVMNAFEVR